jgi:septal ring factor EnvC (AmiA/AmiB activator)
MTRQELQDRRLKLYKQIDSLEREIHEIENQIANLPSTLEHFEMEKSGREWILYTPVKDLELRMGSLQELVSQFMDFREYFYKNDVGVELYDRDKKILVKEFFRVIQYLEDIVPDRETSYKRQRRWRHYGVERPKPTKKQNPITMRPILREEKTW